MRSGGIKIEAVKKMNCLEPEEAPLRHTYTKILVPINTERELFLESPNYKKKSAVKRDKRELEIKQEKFQKIMTHKYFIPVFI